MQTPPHTRRDPYTYRTTYRDPIRISPTSRHIRDDNVYHASWCLARVGGQGACEASGDGRMARGAVESRRSSNRETKRRSTGVSPVVQCGQVVASRRRTSNSAPAPLGGFFSARGGPGSVPRHRAGRRAPRSAFAPQYCAVYITRRPIRRDLDARFTPRSVSYIHRRFTCATMRCCPYLLPAPCNASS